MKALVLISAIFVFFPLYALPQDGVEPHAIVKDSLQIAQTDSTEYELLVSDIGFETWFITNSRPVWYHENDYYRTKNYRYVVSWNNMVRQAMYRPPFEYEIEYDPAIDYGVEVNWKLFWYFKYLEQELGISL
ncbi:MAG: hypothetical protein IH598_02245 [Bacteroidales bacterium]|nr:hypothetical protein [Bacteroidales bacterium]